MDEDRRTETGELLRSAVQEHLNVYASTKRPFTRRDAYLAIWGVVYISVGLILSNTGENLITGASFVIAGGVSAISSLIRGVRLDIAAFTLLAAVAAGRGVWSVTQIISGSGNRVLGVFAAILWLGVAGAQVVVAGWPVPSRDRRGESKPSG